MTIRTPLRALLGTTALALPMMLALPVQAQQNDQQEATSSQQAQNACVDLQALLDEEGGEVTLDYQRLQALIEQGSDERCLVVLDEVERKGGIAAIKTQDDFDTIVARAEDMDIEAVASRDVSATAKVTETVKLEREALVSGEIVVAMPEAKVGVRQGSPQVDVESSQPEVNVRQAAPEVLIRQPKQQIAVDMPRPTITITQQAPEIIVTMPEPGVDVRNAEPTVRFSMPEPEVTVNQPDPKIAFDLDAKMLKTAEADDLRERIEFGEADNPVRTRTEREGDGGQNVTFESANAVVNSTMTDAEPRVTIEQAEPTVRWEATEPQISFNMGGDPEIRLEQVGEPKVTFEQASAKSGDKQSDQASAQSNGANRQAAAENKDGERRLVAEAPGIKDPQNADKGLQMDAGDSTAMNEAERDVEQTADAAGNAVEATAAAAGEAVRETAQAAGNAGDEAASELNQALDMDEGYQPRDMPTEVFMVSDLEGRDVVNMQGEDLGEVGRVVSNNGRTYIVVEHGGFLGIGDEEYVLPVERVMISGDNVILEGLSEAELEAMPEYDESAEEALGADDRIEMRYEG